MNYRIAKLRQASLEAVPTISLERAQLLTEFHRTGAAEGKPAPVARAMAFAYILTHKTIIINPGELIVGERGPAPKATPTYPEICTHTLEDFEVLDSRPKIPFRVGDEERRIQQDTIIPYWQGRSIREAIFEAVDQDWLDAYEAGVFTEFQEQRAPGHTVLDDKIYRLGFLDLIERIERRLEELDQSSDQFENQRDQLTAMALAARALVDYGERHAAELERLAERESDRSRRDELTTMARICRRVPAQRPETFWEALQYYWFVHLGVITELNTWDSFNPGRLDQHLWPFFQRETAAGSLDKERARELLQAFWVKFNNQPAPPKVGVTAKESATYTDFCLINVGGVTPTGEDAVNDLTYLILDVIEEMRLLQPSSMVQVSKKNPDRLLDRALEIIRTGFGQPSLFNTDAIIQEMLRQGKSLTDARTGGASGCVEAGIFGKEAYWLTGYFNLVKVLEVTLHGGTDPRTGKEIGARTPPLALLSSFDSLFDAFQTQLRHFVDIKISGNLIIERLWAEKLPAPFMSLLIDDCLDNARDYNRGGARYNTSYIQGVGIGSITDCLAALKYHVYDRQTVSLPDLMAALAADFDGYDELRDRLIDISPKYGNDDDYADNLLRQVFQAYFESIDGRPNARGGCHRVNLLPTTCHVYFGSVVGAMPDGRRAGTPLSEGISPVQGADRKGPTAVLKSAGKIDHLRTGGTLLNQKFTPDLLQQEDGRTKVLHLVRTYFRMDGHHIQFNVVDAATLRRAQERPEEHRDLIVRVAGYSDYFVDLGESLQNEIIARTEQGAPPRRVIR